MFHQLNFFWHTDPTNDIDDEMAFGDFLPYIKTYKNHNICITVSVVTKGTQRLIDYGSKPFAGLDLDPDSTNVINLEAGNTLTIRFCNGDGTMCFPPEYKPDFILCIAPGLDKVLTEANLENLRGFSHQGLPGSWAGFNDKGSVNILTAMLNKNVPHMITTPFESFANLFSTEFFAKYQIPESVWPIIMQDAFKMIMGRMPPTVPAFVLPMAESLVNIPYAESLGKPGTNARLALAIRNRFTGVIRVISPEYRAKIRTACVGYVNSLIDAATSHGAACPIKHYEQTVDSLEEMTVALAEIGMPTLDETGTRLIYSSDGNLPEKYPEAFEEFKKIGIFTPAYDFIAERKFRTVIESVLNAQSSLQISSGL
jgi:hypothetical protein